MAGSSVHCTKCNRLIEPETYNRRMMSPCPQCGALLEVTVFPALVTPPRRGSRAEDLVLDDEASCFFHPVKRAVVPCDECGRFLCALCDIMVGQRHVCPSCIQSGKADKTSGQMETRRQTYGDLALLLALIPGVAIYLCIRYWAKPESMGQRTRLRLALAAAISSLFFLAGLMLMFTA